MSINFVILSIAGEPSVIYQPYWLSIIKDINECFPQQVFLISLSHKTNLILTNAVYMKLSCLQDKLNFSSFVDQYIFCQGIFREYFFFLFSFSDLDTCPCYC